jgi:hypothetical protein
MIGPYLFNKNINYIFIFKEFLVLYSILKSKMVNYSNSSIYKICCLDPSIKDVYVGSTTNLKIRKQNHKNCCNNSNHKSYNFPVYKLIRENGGFENWEMIEIEKYQATDKRQLHTRERYWLETLEATLNKLVPTRTTKEYYEDNKESVIKKTIEYYEKNKQLLNEKRKVKMTCECGSIHRKDEKSRHIKTKKHKNFINQQL